MMSNQLGNGAAGQVEGCVVGVEAGPDQPHFCGGVEPRPDRGRLVGVQIQEIGVETGSTKGGISELWRRRGDGIAPRTVMRSHRAEVQCQHLDIGVAGLDAPLLPILIPCVMGDPVLIVGRNPLIVF